MIYLFILNVFIAVFFSCAPVVFLSKKLNLNFINPISIAFAISFPTLIMQIAFGPLYSGILNDWVNFALLMENIKLIVEFFLIVTSFRLIRKSYFLRERLIFLFFGKIRLKKARMFFLGGCSYILYIIFFVLLSSSRFGIINWLENPRIGYQYYRVGYGHYYALSLFFLSLSYVILTLYIKKNINLLIVFIVFVISVYILGSKGFILSFFIYILVLLWFKRIKHLSFFILTATTCGFLLALLNFNPSNYKDVIAYFDHYLNSAMYYQAYMSGTIKLFYGEIWLTDFYKYVPRAFYESKPFVYGFLNINEFFFPGAAAASYTPAFGGPVAEFADFGIIGVLFFSFFNMDIFIRVIFIYHLYSKNRDLNKIRKESAAFFVFTWLVAPSFLVFFGAIYSLIILLFLVLCVNFFNRLVFK